MSLVSIHPKRRADPAAPSTEEPGRRRSDRAEAARRRAVLRELRVALFFVDNLMPGNRLPDEALATAARFLCSDFAPVLVMLADQFAELTTLTPGTKAYYRAEFRNILHVFNQVARSKRDGRRSPIMLAMYEVLSWCGCGPHPDLELAAKWRRGLSAAEREERGAGWKRFSSHLRNRVALVRLALDQDSQLTAVRRRKITGADPLIARWLPPRRSER